MGKAYLLNIEAKATNLIFCYTGPTDPNFQQIKIIIILISRMTISFLLSFPFRLQQNTWKTKTLAHLILLNHRVKRCGQLYITYADIIAEVSITWWQTFFLHVPILKLSIIIIFPSDRPKIILLTTCTTKN